jgi:predicted transcriptional regulator
MQREYFKQERREKPYELSEAQKQILTVIIKHMPADYKKIVKETGKRRTTIFQSLQPLLKHHFVAVEKVYPEQKNSKLIFKVTQKGLFYSIAFLSMASIYNETKLFHNRESSPIPNQVINSVPDYAGRKEFLKQTALFLMKHNQFNNEGKLVAIDMQQAMNLGFKMSILESLKEEGFSSTKLFGNLTIQELSKICRPQEKRELIKFLKNMVKNVNSVITYLSKQK